MQILTNQFKPTIDSRYNIIMPGDYIKSSISCTEIGGIKDMFSQDSYNGSLNSGITALATFSYIILLEAILHREGGVRWRFIHMI